MRGLFVLVLLLMACASGGERSSGPVEPRLIEELLPSAEPAAPELEPVDPADTYLQPNARDTDGADAFVHYTREDMPLRVNVDLPRQSARYASREETREAVLSGMRGWGHALQRAYPWFSMQFVENDPAAPVQITWKRRMTGSAAGRGGIGWEVRGGELRLWSMLEYTTQTCLAIECQLTADELRLLVAHEFGHALGLRHCLDCNSAMNYSWHTQERVVVSDHDVRTYRALNEIESGTRSDGTRMKALR